MTVTQSTHKSGWVPNDEAFGARLALVRQRMGWGNVKEAALACGLPTQSWRTWERDGVQPRRLVEVASLIADRTGCDLGWLLAGSRLRGDRQPTRQLSTKGPAPTRPVSTSTTRTNVTRRPTPLRPPVAA